MLYVVASPIGNLEDMTFRSIRILNEVDIIFCEDTRVTKKLLSHYNISKPLIRYIDDHRQSFYLEKLLSCDIALISDAGTPLLSDPGYKLITLARKNDIPVISIPGASALLAAIVSSGLPTDRFIFEGFLPPKKGRQKRIRSVANESATIIYYESPRRLLRTLLQLKEIMGDRPAVVARELTKLYEEIKRGTLSELHSYFSLKAPKGEFVILVGKDDVNVYF